MSPDVSGGTGRRPLHARAAAPSLVSSEVTRLRGGHWAPPRPTAPRPHRRGTAGGSGSARLPDSPSRTHPLGSWKQGREGGRKEKGRREDRGEGGEEEGGGRGGGGGRKEGLPKGRGEGGRALLSPCHSSATLSSQGGRTGTMDREGHRCRAWLAELPAPPPEPA